jgi:hypothetical protein
VREKDIHQEKSGDVKNNPHTQKPPAESLPKNSQGKEKFP